jgi:hypothetical protein
MRMQLTLLLLVLLLVLLLGGKLANGGNGTDPGRQMGGHLNVTQCSGDGNRNDQGVGC